MRFVTLPLHLYLNPTKALEIDAVCGLDARGFVLGPPIALGIKKPFFMMRKKGKMPNTISSSSYDVEYGKREGMCMPRDAVKEASHRQIKRMNSS